MKNRGSAILEAMLSMVVMVVIVIALIMPIKKWVDSVLVKSRLESFSSEAFIGMSIYYFDFANTNGGCLNIVPPPITPEILTLNGLLENNYLEVSHFDPTLTTLSYSASMAGGRVDTMNMVIPITIGNTNDLFGLANLIAKTSNTITLSSPIKFSQSGFVLDNISTVFCKG
ncbi:hypothetical protein [Enterovibrio norvegicus]|uniref:hypothetical protein n=1 Tax=Enterovibrio norvegicus TaxID=188144 RepID=UPI000C819AB5|nr:hypothetical protein [Enterovibrio norvegicus]PMH64439.1 hypothetical protein BCU62_15405 [Enterovibrio norvegicus]